MLNTQETQELKILLSKIRKGIATQPEIDRCDALELKEGRYTSPQVVKSVWHLPMAQGMYNADRRDFK